jgi:hypothetical protein
MIDFARGVWGQQGRTDAKDRCKGQMQRTDAKRAGGRFAEAGDFPQQG